MPKLKGLVIDLILFQGGDFARRAVKSTNFHNWGILKVILPVSDSADSVYALTIYGFRIIWLHVSCL